LALTEEYRRRSSAFDEIVVVFDGTKNPGFSKEYKSGSVKVVFSRFGESADDAIRRILKTARGTSRLTVASDDNYVTNSARAHGADTMSCASLEALFKGRGRKSTAASAEKDLDPKMVCDINESLKKVWKIR
jgi:predicted RNA-binding protein with PIN domain